MQTSFDAPPIGEGSRDILVLQAIALICWVCGKQAAAWLRVDLTRDPDVARRSRRRRRPRLTRGVGMRADLGTVRETDGLEDVPDAR